MKEDYRHILFATDFSEEAIQIGKRAVDLARRYNAKFSLLHVVEYTGVFGDRELVPPVMPVAAGGFVPPIPPETTEDDMVKKESDLLNQLAERLGVADSERWVITSPSTKDEIHRVAKEQDVDLIVVGSHGRHGLALLLGSTANAVLHGAPCDVLAVRVKS